MKFSRGEKKGGMKDVKVLEGNAFKENTHTRKQHRSYVVHLSSIFNQCVSDNKADTIQSWTAGKQLAQQVHSKTREHTLNNCNGLTKWIETKYT